MDLTEYAIEDITDTLVLNCGISPSLKTIEMNQLSDEINFICNSIIFDGFNHDDYKKIKTEMDNDKKTFMTSFLFPSEISSSDFNIVKKLPEFKVSIEALIEKLEYINNKKNNLQGPKFIVTSILFIYVIAYIIIFLIYLTYLLSDDQGDSQKAEQYNIGFISSAAYIYLFMKMKDHFFEYSQLNNQIGHYDESVCNALSNVITCIKQIYINCLDLIKNTEACKKSIVNEAVKLYKLIYEDQVFQRANSHFKGTVNAINAFIDKQKRYLLKVHNTTIESKNNNEYMEELYNILVHGHGVSKLKSLQTEKLPDAKRQGIYNNIGKKTVDNQTFSHWESYIIENLIDKIIFISSTNTTETTIKTNLKGILEFLKEITNLPEYDEVKKLIFPLEMNNYTNYSTDTYLNLVYDSLKTNSQLDIPTTERIITYFSETVIGNYKERNLLVFDDKNAIDKLKTYNGFLSKITKRMSNVSVMKKKYFDFINAIKNRMLIEDDLKDEELYGDIFDMIVKDFIENTKEYKLNENIVMRFMTFLFKNDDELENNNSSRLIISNIKLIITKMMKKVEQSQSIRNDLTDAKNMNTAKYISFLNFESKMSELSTEDIEGFSMYITKTKETIKNFRRYTKTEETLFSKKEQIHHVYNKVHRDIFIVVGILIAVFIYEEYFKDKVSNMKYKDLAKFGDKASKAVGKASKKIGEASRFVKQKASDAASYVGNTTTDGIAGIAAAPLRIENMAKESISRFGEGFNLLGKKAKEARQKARQAKGGNNPVATDEKKEQQQEQSEATEPTEPTEPTGKQSKAEKETQQIEKALSFNKYINMSLIIVVYGIFLTFTKSYLMKHGADLQYDKVVNVINTSKFEREFFQLKDSFDKYKVSRSTQDCKNVYTSLIDVLEIYDKCNFIRSSIKTTPFPAAEMWTNGVILLIFLMVLYITFVQTDVNSYWENQNKLEELMNSLDTIGVNDDEEEVIKKIQKDLDREKDKMNKAIDKFNWSDSKKYMMDIYNINDDMKKMMKEVFEEYSQKGKNKISDEDKRDAYKKLVDKLEDEIEKASPKQTGGMMPSYPMIDPTKVGPVNNDAKLQKKLLEQYTNQVNAVQAQIVKMKRDTKYVNLSMSIMILLFGSYFCVTILNNTRNYQNMLTSGGILFRDCL